jgi:AraC-like DNA-binding protein
MSGHSSGYRLDPSQEHVIGIIESGAMAARRGRRRELFNAGDICCWAPTSTHSGTPAAGATWRARLIIVEGRDFGELVEDPDASPLRGLETPERIDDPDVSARFLRMHRALERGESALEAETLLVEFVQGLFGSLRVESVPDPLREPALRRACEFIADEPEGAPTLSELAAVAGVSRHRLARLFRGAFGVPPHRYLLARRIRRARRLLEAGWALAAVAQMTGFHDQSHLSRHFRKSTGVTPGRYQRLVRSNVQYSPKTPG